MVLSDFDYFLPKELIAQEGLSRRDEARLMILCRDGSWRHTTIKNFPELFREGDLLILNDTRVLQSKLLGKKMTGGKIDCLVLPETNNNQSLSNTYNLRKKVLLRGNNIKSGTEINFFSNHNHADKRVLHAKVIGKIDGAMYQIEFDGTAPIEAFAQIPLPPYIKKPLSDPDRYQTIYSQKSDSPLSTGSLAAPTAGLHFTSELMEKIKAAGVETLFLTLHIGIGTFAPIRTEKLQDWQIDPEYYQLTEPSARRLNEALRSKRRIFAVGTTTIRALESASADGIVRAGEGWSDIFIYPPYQFKLSYSGLLTNFHLPKSTLLLLVSAFAESLKTTAISGKEKILLAYAEAIEKKYRFYSFGDAMLILK